jgi:hypothetical protein
MSIVMKPGQNSRFAGRSRSGSGGRSPVTVVPAASAEPLRLLKQCDLGMVNPRTSASLSVSCFVNSAPCQAMN